MAEDEGNVVAIHVGPEYAVLLARLLEGIVGTVVAHKFGRFDESRVPDKPLL